MPIHAVVATSRTHPEPAVLVVLNSFKEMSAHLETALFTSGGTV